VGAAGREELGAAQWLTIPERNAAERQAARHEEGASTEEIFAEQVRERVSESPAELPSPGARSPPKRALNSSSRSCEARASPTCSFTRARSSASLAYGKLAPEVRDLEQARLAIDALKALVPVLPEDRSRELQQLVANLQLAYADAAAG
jgi:hypothetical protein